jgi:hypothetical protein
MTCVAYDGKSIAADRRSTWDREPTPHGTDKIRLLRQGQRRFAVAHAGVEGQAYRMLTHHLFGHRNAGVLEPYAKLGDENATLMVLELLPESCHRVTLIGIDGGETDVTDAPASLGCGGDYAMGAMHAGATAVEAVLIACKLDTRCGDGYTTFQLADLQAMPLSAFKSITGD